MKATPIIPGVLYLVTYRRKIQFIFAGNGIDAILRSFK